METGATLIYDGSFNGFLSAIYQSFDCNIYVTNIVKENEYQKDIFSKVVKIETDLNSAKRVWFKLRDEHYEALKSIYFAYLSETEGIEIRLYREIVRKIGRSAVANKGDAHREANYIEDLANNVSREKRKWEASIDLNFSQDKPAIVRIKPTNNILPLISRFFRLTYHSNPWIIFDDDRNYGIYYDGIGTRIITEIPQQFNWADAA